MKLDELRPLVVSVLQEEAKHRNAKLDKARNQTLIVLTILFVLAIIFTLK